MNTETITVQTRTGNVDSEGKQIFKKATFTHSFPTSLDEAKQMFGEENVFNEFLGGYRVTIQAPARKVLEGCEGEDVESNSNAVQTFMDQWKLGEKSPRTRVVKVDVASSILSNWDNMSPEEQARILAALGEKTGLAVPAAQAQENGGTESAETRRARVR